MLERFYRVYGEALEEGDAALFVGAGLSVPAGFVDWKTLLREIADELGLSVDRETDLLALAQYHANDQGNRAVLNRRLIQEFNKDHEITRNHLLISQLPIRTVWTTNYDRLIERAFESSGKRVDRKTTQENLSTTLPKRDVTVYKMHGDIEQPQEAVLTKEDYETYSKKRSLFITALQGDLIEKTFFFVGLSFTDPNIEYLLGRIRALLGENPREHFWITRRVPRVADADPAKMVEYEYEVKRQHHKVRDLKRYGITAILVDEYADITLVLENLLDRLRSRSIFVSGSMHIAGGMGPERLERLAQRLGKEIIARGHRLVSGFGLGIGSAVLMGAVGELYTGRDRLEDRVVLRPFPRTSVPKEERVAVYTQHRKELLKQVRFSIFIAGNRKNPDGDEVQIAPGVLEEFEIGVAHGVVPIPIGATGFAAEVIWKRINADLTTFFPGVDLQGPMDVLGDSSRTDDEWLEAVFQIVDAVNKATK